MAIWDGADVVTRALGKVRGGVGEVGGSGDRRVADLLRNTGRNSAMGVEARIRKVGVQELSAKDGAVGSSPQRDESTIHI